jgi:hypothetical protein
MVQRAGYALLVIKNRKLFKPLYSSFESFCIARLDYQVNYAYQLITSYIVQSNLVELLPDDMPTPKRVNLLREMSKFKNLSHAANYYISAFLDLKRIPTLNEFLIVKNKELGVVTPANGTPANGTPANGTPANGTPANGTPANGTPANGTPANGTPANGTPAKPGPNAHDANGTKPPGKPTDSVIVPGGSKVVIKSNLSTIQEQNNAEVNKLIQAITAIINNKDYPHASKMQVIGLSSDNASIVIPFKFN